MEKDINDVFDDLLLSEDQVSRQGYAEGFEAGQAQGNPDGYHLGYHRGAEIGAELGHYLAVVRRYLESVPGVREAATVTAVAQQTQRMIKEFPQTNVDTGTDILALVEEIRARYRRTCSLLNLDCRFKENDGPSF